MPGGPAMSGEPDGPGQPPVADARSVDALAAGASAAPGSGAGPLVVKVSGKVGESYAAVAEDVAGLVRAGRPTVLVHGGSAAIDEVSRHRGIPPRRVVSVSGVEGRYTTEADLDTLLMATAGLVNKTLVLRLHRHGVAGVGLSGLDGGLLRGPRKDVLRIVENGRARLLRGNHSGDVDRVETGLLWALLGRGAVPVVAPLALSWDDRVMNVDGDRVAAAIAAALGARDLVLLSDVPGLIDGAAGSGDVGGDGTAASAAGVAGAARAASAGGSGDVGRPGGPVVPGGDLAELRERLMPMARGRMRVKLGAAEAALRHGVTRVVIASARVPGPVTAALSGDGTQLRAGGSDGSG